MAEMKHTPATSDGWLAHSCGHRVTVLQRHDVRRARVGGGTGVRTRLDTVTTTAAREKCGGYLLSPGLDWVGGPHWFHLSQGEETVTPITQS